LNKDLALGRYLIKFNCCNTFSVIGTLSWPRTKPFACSVKVKTVEINAGNKEHVHAKFFG